MGEEQRSRLPGGRLALPLGSGAIPLRPECAEPTQQNQSPQLVGPTSVEGGLSFVVMWAQMFFEE